MLTELHIENIAIIESAGIEFADGLNVLSGETGSGKSIIIDALSAVLGERTSKDLIRTGEDRATVSALFVNVSDDVEAALAELGLTPSEDRTLLVQRVISLEGRSSCRINGEPATVSMLKTLGKELISIHGQHDSQHLLNPEVHYRYLDALGGLAPVYEDYLGKYQEYVGLDRKFRSLQKNEEESARRMDFLKYEIKEIEDANVVSGEYETLNERRSFFRNSEKIVKKLENALDALTDGDLNSGAVSQALSAAHDLELPAKHLTEAEQLSRTVSDAAYALQDAREQLKELIYNYAFDPTEQSEVEDRMSLLFKLRSKYGADEDAVLAHLEEDRAELASLQNADSDRKELEELLEVKKDLLLAAAEKLRTERKQIANEFERKVGEELAFLDMPHARLSTSFTPCRLSPVGSDDIEFLIAPNPGEDPKPLAKIASGGELSRIMLAIQNVLSEKGNVQTLIFDEIDTGVSGSAAEKIAIKLHSAAGNHQVICITHSAQVAAYADHHFNISKEVRSGKTYTNVLPLDTEGRVHEIARIIGGVNITDLQVENARDMLQRAHQA
ncbi:MAG: DNA repair protein RecN [Clostridia bacterium]|nr:DNA repair protein RecN [Clostridia bacterium]